MQNKVKNFNDLVRNTHAKKMTVEARVLDIQSEVGELSKEILKSTKYGTLPFTLSENFRMEFGDVLYALLSLANETEIDANASLDMAIEKLNKRMAAKNNLGSDN